MPPFLYKFALSGVSPLNGFVYPNLFCWFPKPINSTCSIEPNEVRRGNVGGYFAKQNNHSGATPPQWRAGSSLSATIVAPFLYKNALLRNGFGFSNLICEFPKPINNTCSIEQTKFEGGMWAVILRSKMPTRGRSPRNGVQAPACRRDYSRAFFV